MSKQLNAKHKVKDFYNRGYPLWQLLDQNKEIWSIVLGELEIQIG